MTAVHITLKEWQAVGPGTRAAMRELHGFRFESAADRELAEQLTQSGKLIFHERHDGLQIRATAQVGRVQLGRLCVTIVPKVGPSDLLVLFRYAYGLRDIPPLSATRYAATGVLLHDLLIRQLCDETRVLFERGVVRQYVPRNESLTSPRGRIDVQRLAVQGARTTVELPCRHHPRDSDNVLNRTLLAGIDHARRLAQDTDLRLELARLQSALKELTTATPLSLQLLRDADRKLTRLVFPYTSILHIIELLYHGSYLDLEMDAADQPLPGFLFDMNRFFQHLLQRFLEDNLPPPWRVEAELSLSDMLRYLPTENPRHRRAPSPRPDFAIKRAGRVVKLLDAKYRDLWEQALPRDMLYQLSMYALSQARGSTAVILHPTTDPAARVARIEVRDPSRDSATGYVALRPVLLSRMVGLVGGSVTDQRAERAAWAYELADIRSSQLVGSRNA